MDTGGWLRSLGLGQYEANFRDNKIDADVLPQLTADDLKDLGVSAVGDRRRLLAAIAVLSVETPSASVVPSLPKPRPAQVVLRTFPLPRQSLLHPRAIRQPSAVRSR